MRTTLTLDDDVFALLSAEIKKSGAPFKQAVNHYLRLGLAGAAEPASERFVVNARALGLPSGMSYDNIGQLIEDLDGADHR